MDIERISQITGIDTTAGPEEAVWERLERRPDKRDAKTGLASRPDARCRHCLMLCGY